MKDMNPSCALLTEINIEPSIILSTSQTHCLKKKRELWNILVYFYLPHISKKLIQCFCFLPYQSPEEIDKGEVHLSDTEKKMNPAEENKNVYTEKHSDNLFKRTEVLAGEYLAGGQWEGA